MKTLRCPICHKPVNMPVDHSGLSTFPFCSDRCRLVDLGRWLNGKYQIPVVSEEDNQDDPDENGPVFRRGEDDQPD